MSSEVWYRKWRPQSFAEVHGQDHVVRTLANAVASGRVAHAYLLCGPRGTGKTTTARLLAKAVNCTNPRDGEPCNECASCRAVAEGRALDLVEMDAASNRGIDDIRNLRDRVGYHPSEGRYRVYLIDEVHELTAQAFDALLKTLEEPPAHVIFVLATTDAHKVPATIISRCQRFDLGRIRHADIVDRLRFIADQEGVEVEDGALDIVARSASGGLRDAVNLLEQLVSSFGSPLTADQASSGLGLVADVRARQLGILAIQGDFAAGLGLIGAVQDDGIDMRQFNRQVVAELRAMLLARAGASAGLEGLSVDARRELVTEVEALDTRRIVRALKAFSAIDFRGEQQPSLPVELALAEVTILAGGADDTERTALPARPAAAGRQEVAVPPSPVRPAEAPAPPSGVRVLEAPPSRTPAAPRGGPSIPPPVPVVLSPISPAPPSQEMPPAAAEQSAPTPILGAVNNDQSSIAGAAAPLDAGHGASPKGADSGAAQSGSAEPPAPVDAAPEAADSALPASKGASASGAGLSLEQARGRMREIYERLQRSRETRQAAGLLNSGCDIIACDDRTITFGFRHPFLAEKALPGTANNKAIAAEVEQVLGRHYEIQSVHVPDVEDRLRATPPRASHLLDEAIKQGGVVINRP